MIRAGSGAALGVAGVLLCACANPSSLDAARSATAFASEAGARDAAAACALLTPTTRAALEHVDDLPCLAALPRHPVGSGTVRSVEVWGTWAQVRLDDDTLFLTRTADGWRVAAAGCEPHGDAPYDCRVVGP